MANNDGANSDNRLWWYARERGEFKLTVLFIGVNEKGLWRAYVRLLGAELIGNDT